MRRIIQLPAPQLSTLKEVHIDLEMTGRHYAILASCEGQAPEDVALSILDDLMDEDAGLLTMAEVRYLFMLVKINSLENKYTVTVECHHPKKDGSPCNCKNEFDLFLSDADLNKTPSDYVPPKVLMNVDGKEEKEYSVLPPPMKMESQLFDYFLTQRNVGRADIANDRKVLMDYTFVRAIMHLVDSDGVRAVKQEDNLDDVLNLLDVNKYKNVNKLYQATIDVGNYGVQDKDYEFKCKECGGKLSFHLPLLYGVSG